MVRVDDKAVDPCCADARLGRVTEADRHPLSLGEPEPEPRLVAAHVGVGDSQGNKVRGLPVATIVKRADQVPGSLCEPKGRIVRSRSDFVPRGGAGPWRCMSFSRRMVLNPWCSRNSVPALQDRLQLHCSVVGSLSWLRTRSRRRLPSRRRRQPGWTTMRKWRRSTGSPVRRVEVRTAASLPWTSLTAKSRPPRLNDMAVKPRQSCTVGGPTRGSRGPVASSWVTWSESLSR